MDGIDRIGIGDSLRADGYRINRRTGEEMVFHHGYHELVDGSEVYHGVVGPDRGEANDERALQALDVKMPTRLRVPSLSNMSHDIRTFKRHHRYDGHCKIQLIQPGTRGGLSG